MIKAAHKKFIALLLPLVLISTFAGLSLPANAAVVTLKIWDPGLMGHLNDGVLDTKISFIYKAKVAFEKKNPNIKIDISELDGGIADTQFRAASIAKNGPDLRVGFAGGSTLSFSQFLEPLDKHFTAAELSKLKGTNTLREGFKPSGKLFGLPYGAGSYFYVFYNKQMMKDYNIDMSKPPATWEDFLFLGQILRSQGVKNPIWETNLEGYTGAWVIASLVGGLLGPSAFGDMYSGKTSINSAAVRKAYAAYATLYTSNVTNPDATTLSHGERLSGFLSGKGAMIIDGGWDNDPIFKAMGSNVGQFPIPTLAGSKYPGILAGGTNVAVSMTNYGKHKPEALKFLKFLAEASTIDMYVQTTQTEASNHVNGNSKVIINGLLRSQAGDVAKRLQVYPFDNIMPGPVNDLFYRVNNSVGLGQTTPAEAAKQLADEFAKNK